MRFPVVHGGRYMDNKESKKQKDIENIIELLKKDTPEKVSEILICVINYLST